MRQLAPLIVLIFALAFSAGCTEVEANNPFLGEWVRVDNPRDVFEIVPSGDSFLLLDDDGKQFSASLTADGTLSVSGPYGLMVFIDAHELN